MVHVALVSWPKALDPSSSATLYLYSLTDTTEDRNELLITVRHLAKFQVLAVALKPSSSPSPIKDAVYPRRGSAVRSAHGHTSFLGYNPQQGLQLSLGIQGAGCTRFACAAARGFGLLHPPSTPSEKGHVEYLATPLTAEQEAKTRFNDGACDARGRFFAGTLADENAKGGSLWSYGIGDEGIRLVDDRDIRQILAYDYDIETGNVSGRRVHIDIPKMHGFQMGYASIPREGSGAHIGGAPSWSAFLQRENHTCSSNPGALNVTACTFGGPNNDRLFVTTASPEASPRPTPRSRIIPSLEICSRRDICDLYPGCARYQQSVTVLRTFPKGRALCLVKPSCGIPALPWQTTLPRPTAYHLLQPTSPATKTYTTIPTHRSRQTNYAQSPSETPVPTLPDMSARANIGSRFSTTALAPGPDGSRVVVAGKDTLRILRIEDPEPPQPTNYVNYSGDGTNSPTSRRSAKSLSRFFGPNESVISSDTNLWSGAGSKLGFQSAIVDVEWSHQNFSNIIITAFGAGELVSWDLNKASGAKFADRTAPGAHIRSINCIRISPSIGSVLLTASQDGYVKYWDLRSFKPVVQIAHHGMAVRALAFSPGTESAQALVGLETGQLLRYDFRSPKTALDRLPVAHSSAILSIDWQSIGSGGTAGWAATGGMDKTVKIWDMNAPQMATLPIHTLHTTHPVKQAAWRPGYETEIAVVHLTPGISPQKAGVLGSTTSLVGIDMSLQIHAHGAKTPMLSSSPASHFIAKGPSHRQRALSHSETLITSASTDNLLQLGTVGHSSQPTAYDGDADRIEIWDVRRNWVAKYVLGDSVADGPVTELVWPNGGSRSAAPGSTLWVAYTSGTFSQHDMRNVFRPLDSIPRNGVTWETRGRPSARVMFLNRGGKEKSVADPAYVPRTQVKGSVPIPSFELGTFVKLARAYLFGGEPREHICLHNAQAALEAGQYRASQAWHMLLSLLTPLVVEGPLLPQIEAHDHASRLYTSLSGTHTPSPHSNQGSRAPSSGPAHGSFQRKSESPRRKYHTSRSRRPAVTRRTSRGSGSGSGHSKVTTRSRSVSVDSNSSLKHVGGGALDDESDSSDGDISKVNWKISLLINPPPGASGLSLIRTYTPRRIGGIGLVASSRLTVPNEADEHNLSLMGGGSSDEHLHTDTEPLHNSPTSDLEPSPETDSDTNTGPNSTLATWKPDTIPLPRTDSKSSVGTAKPSSLHPGNASPHLGRHGKERSGDSINAHRNSPVVSRSHSLNAHKKAASDPNHGIRTRASTQTIFPDRGRPRKSRRDVNEAGKGDLQMSAALSTVGGVELGISPETHERIVDAYLDMLCRLRLYAPAAYVRNTPNPSLQRGKPRMFPWGHQECYRSYYLSRPLANVDGSSTAANSRTSTILESDPKSGTPSMQSLGLGAETEKPFDDAASVKTEKTQDTLITDPGNRNSMELPAQDGKSSAEWSPRGHPCAAGVDIMLGLERS
ncbi:WD40 repeats protein [Rhizoctonia solani]|uniref:WD40 repeats protein n=1 Tax=Rhizoctonia solani TaxID=456999 RepID=A0A8H7M5G0_9AGAM|nr:WD40 repeats protein [Rhizoctonia solani]